MYATIKREFGHLARDAPRGWRRTRRS
jgi:hypothetical protein